MHEQGKVSKEMIVIAVKGRIMAFGRDYCYYHLLQTEGQDAQVTAALCTVRMYVQ